MKKDQERLLNLYNDNKISEDDFHLLKKALEEKKTWSQKFFHRFINPFDRVAGYPALALGLLILALMSLISQSASIHFPGLFDLKIFSPTAEKITLNFQKIFLQNMVISLSLATAFYFSGRINKKSSLRFIDFLGTTMMARFPYLVASLVFFALHLRGTNLHFDKVEDVNTYTLSIITFTALISIVWLVATYFYSLKESSGLRGKALWVSFIASLIAIEILTLYLNHQLL